jgi:hypothetical protein
MIAQSTTAHRPSRIISSNDEQDFEIDGPDDFTVENLQRRRSSRVNLIKFFFSSIQSNIIFFSSVHFDLFLIQFFFQFFLI